MNKDPFVLYNHLLDKANAVYADAKTKQWGVPDVSYMAPEQFPSIASEQVKAILRVIAEELAKETK